MSSIIRSSVILPRRAAPQPAQRFNLSGDCGACCLSGLFDLPLSEVYQHFMDGPPRGFSWPAMKQALHLASGMGLAEQVVTEVPTWPVYDAHRAWGSLGLSQAVGWRGYVRMALEAGYYGLAEVDFSKSGPGSLPDHFVLLCGIRQVEKALAGGGAVINTELLVSCSAAHPQGVWVEDLEFLRRWGGFHVLLARPTAER